MAATATAVVVFVGVVSATGSSYPPQFFKFALVLPLFILAVLHPRLSPAAPCRADRQFLVDARSAHHHPHQHHRSQSPATSPALFATLRRRCLLTCSQFADGAALCCLRCLRRRRRRFASLPEDFFADGRFFARFATLLRDCRRMWMFAQTRSIVYGYAQEARLRVVRD